MPNSGFCYCWHGCTREVFLVGPLAIKIPKLRYGWKMFLQGLLANLQERAFARLNDPRLCPVLFSLPGGWLLVMRRAQAMAHDRWLSFDACQFCAATEDTALLPVEYVKRDSFGLLDGRVVAIDYG